VQAKNTVTIISVTHAGNRKANVARFVERRVSRRNASAKLLLHRRRSSKKPRHVQPAVPQPVPLAPAVVTNRTEATKTEWIEYDRVSHAVRLQDNTVEVDKQLIAIKKRIEKGRMQVNYALTNNTGRLITDVGTSNLPDWLRRCVLNETCSDLKIFNASVTVYIQLAARYIGSDWVQNEMEIINMYANKRDEVVNHLYRQKDSRFATAESVMKEFQIALYGGTSVAIRAETLLVSFKREVDKTTRALMDIHALSQHHGKDHVFTNNTFCSSIIETHENQILTSLD
jgi:hypothetical protein